jgi:uncharacterized protein YfaS (alpha-2-macroglobulin family)
MTKLSGRVSDEAGNPAADAVVELVNSAGDVVDSVRTDDNGTYTYHLSAGAWTINAWDSHGGRAAGSATVSEGEDRSMDVTLTSEQGGGA